MTLGGDDGQPTTAEVLASIRRTIKSGQLDEIPPSEISLPAGAGTSSEPDDFELPAMFRRDREAAPVLTASLVDRIGAALGSLDETNDRARREHDPAPLSPTPPTLAAARDLSALDIGKPRVPPQPTTAEVIPSADAAARPKPVPREMPPCRDRLVVRMAGPVEPRLSPAPPPAVPKGAMGSFNYLLGAVETGPSDEDDERAMPPPLPLSERAASDLDANVLRPMLRQWLDDNINRVLTEALIQTLQRDRQ